MQCAISSSRCLLLPCYILSYPKLSSYILPLSASVPLLTGASPPGVPLRVLVSLNSKYPPLWAHLDVPRPILHHITILNFIALYFTISYHLFSNPKKQMHWFHGILKRSYRDSLHALIVTLPHMPRWSPNPWWGEGGGRLVPYALPYGQSFLISFLFQDENGMRNTRSGDLMSAVINSLRKHRKIFFGSLDEHFTSSGVTVSA